NAIKFTPPGGAVRLSCYREGQFVVWDVVDNGRGIAPDVLPHIFERFRQGEGAPLRSTGGLGLGLSIARQLVDLHGGHIGAASDGPGRGSVFSVRLPAAESTAEEAPAASSVVMTERGLLDGATILVVDDDGDTRELLLVLLAEAGARAIAACSAEEARAILGGGHVDVMVCDVEMPH